MLSAAPAHAATVDIDLTQNGPSPQHRTVASGDRVRFVNTDTFPHSLRSSTPNWSFDVMVNPGSATTPIRLTAAGTYGYQGTNFDTFTGDVRVPGAGPSPSPTRSRPPSPSAAASSAPPSASPASSAPATRGPSPSAADSPPAAASPRATPRRSAAPTAAPTPPAATPGGGAGTPTPAGLVVSGGPPPEPPTDRALGLPAALAAVALVGAATLLGRALLAEVPPGPA